MSSRSLRLEPAHDGVEGTMSDNRVNQHPDRASEAHVVLICTITL